MLHVHISTLQIPSSFDSLKIYRSSTDFFFIYSYVWTLNQNYYTDMHPHHKTIIWDTYIDQFMLQLSFKLLFLLLLDFKSFFHIVLLCRWPRWFTHAMTAHFRLLTREAGKTTRPIMRSNTKWNPFWPNSPVICHSTKASSSRNSTANNAMPVSCSRRVSRIIFKARSTNPTRWVLNYITNIMSSSPQYIWASIFSFRGMDCQPLVLHFHTCWLQIYIWLWLRIGLFYSLLVYCIVVQDLAASLDVINCLLFFILV